MNTNIAIATLDSACYSQSGRIDMLMKVTLGGITHTIMRITGYVQNGGTTVIIDSDHYIPSLEDLENTFSRPECV